MKSFTKSLAPIAITIVSSLAAFKIFDSIKKSRARKAATGAKSEGAAPLRNSDLETELRAWMPGLRDSKAIN